MKKLLILASTVLLLSILISCGEKDKDKDYEYNMMNFFDQYLSTLCEASTRCTSGFVNTSNVSYCPDIIMNNPSTFEGFHKKENVLFRHKYEMMISGERMGWIKVDMDKAEKCYTVISKLDPCNPLDVQLLDISECANVFNGTKFLKQECYQDEECDNGWCDLKGDRCPGNCVFYKEPGQECNASLDRCSPGYLCRSSGCSEASNGVPGDPCVSDDDCSSFLFCRITGTDSIGNCYKRQGEGQACIEEKECVVGLECINNLCTRSRISDQVGAPCGPQASVGDEEEVVLSCNVFSKLECGVTNTCQKLSSQQNTPCTSMCDKTLYCDNNFHVCLYQGDIGKPCTQDSQCVTMYCYNNVCATPECLTVE
ncbi:MAG TPA: Dickkopf N-terminal cysteine-rich domain-containing protein [bacterium]|nr:Dickkopf N-terminal cysteine-rich domain-containing protein [bacterium]HPS29713.1 Dickkopf N-terminal cysteine-rich domain-containing protein [bacterium]